MAKANKLPCNLIQELLPSYIDGITGDESTKMIAEHLQGCKNCSAKYEMMVHPELEEELAIPYNAEQEGVAFLKKIKRRQHVKVAAIVTIILLLAVAASYLLYGKINPLPVDKMSVSERYWLSNGSLYVKIKMEDTRFAELRTWAFGNYATAAAFEGAASGSLDTTTTDYSFGYRLLDLLKIHSSDKTGYLHLIVPVDHHSFNQETVNLWGWGSDKVLVLWKNGDNVPIAPKDIDIEASSHSNFWTTSE